jgi:hypothetical protein
MKKTLESQAKDNNLKALFKSTANKRLIQSEKIVNILKNDVWHIGKEKFK